MQWLETFSLVMRSSISSLREKIEDPERLLNHRHGRRVIARPRERGRRDRR